MQVITEFLAGNRPIVYLFIFFGKMLEVSLTSLRAQLIMRGQRLPGAIVALIEYTFWLFITGSALAGLSKNPLKILALVIAFSLGHVLGSIIEGKMALGYCTVTGVFVDKNTALSAADMLREQGQALTLIPAEGVMGAERMEIQTTVKRRHVPQVKALIFAADPNAVITVQDTQQVRGATIASFIK